MEFQRHAMPIHLHHLTPRHAMSITGMAIFLALVNLIAADVPGAHASTVGQLDPAAQRYESGYRHAEQYLQLEGALLELERPSSGRTDTAGSSFIHRPDLDHHSGKSNEWRRLLQASELGPTCDLCADNWLFILGAGGRTASTTALTMFGLLPDFEISGEHKGYLINLMLMFNQLIGLERARLDKGRGGEGNAWKQNPLDWHRLKCEAQHMAKAVLLGDTYDERVGTTRVYGFKEIRYTRFPVLPFLAWLFPCARTVWTYRLFAGAEVKASKFAKRNYNQVWRENAELMHILQGNFSATMGKLPAEKLTTARYNRMITSLLGVKGCSFKYVLHENAVRYLRNDTYDREQRKQVMDGECDYSALDFRLTHQQIEQNRQLWSKIATDMHIENWAWPPLE